jgi:hypothetical protein
MGRHCFKGVFAMRPGIRLLTGPELTSYTNSPQAERAALIERLKPSPLCAACGQIATGHLVLNGARAGEKRYQYDPPILLSICADCYQDNQVIIHRLVQHYFPFAVGIRLSY